MVIPWKYCCIIIFILVTGSLRSQDIQVTIDSLKQSAEHSKDPEHKIDALLQLAKISRSTNPGGAAEYARKAYNLAKQENLPLYKIRAMIETGWILVTKTKIDSSMKIATEARHLAEINHFDREYGMAILMIGVNQNYLGNFEESLINFYNAYGIFERINDQEGTVLALNSIGSYCYQQKNMEKAFFYYNKALGKARALKNSELISSVLNNMGLVLSSTNKKDKAEECFKEAIARNKASGHLFRLASNYMNLGLIYLDEGKYELFMTYYKLATAIFIRTGNANKLALCYLNLGDYYVKRKMSDSAVYFSKKAYTIGLDNNLKEVVTNSAQQLEQIYHTGKMTDSAYRYLRIHYIYKDSLDGEINSARLSKLELQYQYENSRRQEKLQQQKKDLYLSIIIILIVSVLIITFLFLSRQIVKNKNINLEKQLLSDDLEFKNKELAVNVMNLLKKNEFIVEHTRRLIEIQHQTQEEDTKTNILQIIQSLQRDSGEKAWDEFELRFRQVHSGFYDRLLKNYPDLTSNELKLCALLRLNLTTKEICELTGQRPASLEVARSRMRKKLGISNPQTNLITFLTQI